MGNIFKKKGYDTKADPWWINFHDEAGRRRRLNTGTPNAAQAALILAKKLVQVAEKRFLDVKDVDDTLFADHQAAVLALKKQMKSYRSMVIIAKVLNETFGRTRLLDITLEKVLAFQSQTQTRTVGKKTKRPITPARVNRFTTQLHEMLEYAVEYGKIPKNPMRSKKFSKLLEEEKIVRPLEVGQWRALEKAAWDLAPRWFYALMATAFHTGLRQANQIHLLRDQIDFENRKLLIGKTKSGRALYLAMSDELLAVLRSIPVHPDSPYVFVDAQGALLVKNVTAEGAPFRRYWGLVKTAAGMPGMKWHEFRHNFGSQLAMLGRSQREIMDAMGHRSVATSMRYMHWAPQQQLEAVNALGRKFGTFSVGGTSQEVQVGHPAGTGPKLIEGPLTERAAKTVEEIERFE